MTIKINDVSITLTKEQLDQVAKHLAKQVEPKHLPEGTICWVGKKLDSVRIADGTGGFYPNGNSKGIASGTWAYFEPIEMGLIFSDTVILSEDITLEMDKQLALCWDMSDKTVKALRVTDAKNKGVFSYPGIRHTTPARYANYIICSTPYPNLPQWAKDMIDICED